jgi:hypothetical protein
MLDPTTPRRRRAANIGAVLAVVVLVLGYRRAEHRWCSTCWAEMDVQTFEVAGVPVWRSTSVLSEPGTEISRFLPPGHVHDAASPGRRHKLDGALPYFLLCFSTQCWFGYYRSEFAATLAQDTGFADFLTDRIERGELDVATVRRLIAVPSWMARSRARSPAWEDADDHAALLRTGTELYAAYRRADLGTIQLWNGFGLPLEEPRYIPADGR